MKLLRLRAEDRQHVAVVVDGEGDDGVAVGVAITVLEGQGRRPLDTDDPLDVLALSLADREELEAEARAVLSDHARRASAVARGLVGEVDSLDLLAPVADPSKIVCLALNYRSHADEGGFSAPDRPVGFLKGAHTLIGHGKVVRVPPDCHRVDHEGELAVVIGRTCRQVAAEDWRDVVAGYTVVNDLTARDVQLEDIEQNHPWDLAKNLDGFAPMGPWLCSADEVPDPMNLPLLVTVDGEIRQEGSTASMIFDVPAAIEYLSRLMTLQRGDVIATGTCDGIGPVPDGSVVEVDLGPTLGHLSTRVVHAGGRHELS